jgi:hypothetical protein
MGFFSNLVQTGGRRKRQPTPAEAAEIRAHLGRLVDHPDYPEALELALADPVAALESFRAGPQPRIVPEEQSREAMRNLIAWWVEHRGAA